MRLRRNQCPPLSGASMNKTIERVLFNPNNGRLAIGFRLRFMDKYHEEPIASLGTYSLRLEPFECDAWAINNEDGVWIVVHADLMKDIEDLGEL